MIRFGNTSETAIKGVLRPEEHRKENLRKSVKKLIEMKKAEPELKIRKQQERKNGKDSSEDTESEAAEVTLAAQ